MYLSLHWVDLSQEVEFTTFRRFKSTKSLNKLVVWGQNPFSLILKLSSVGSPCIGNIRRYEKVTPGISMRGEFPPAKIPGGDYSWRVPWSHHRPEFGEASAYLTTEASGTDHHEITFRIHMVDTGSIPAFGIHRDEFRENKHSTRKR